MSRHFHRDPLAVSPGGPGGVQEVGQGPRCWDWDWGRGLSSGKLNFYNCLSVFVAIFSAIFFLTCTHGRCVEVPAPPSAVDSVLAHQAVAAVAGEPNKIK